jgi:glyoxylase-like metal-dependent hydrolase (beta-lactamase superfamily II)
MHEQQSKNPTDLFKSLRGASPEEAKFFWSGGPVEVAERTWFQSVFSGCTGFETDEGVVLVDSGLLPLGEKLAALLRQKTGAPIHTAIFTHGHVDHAFGLAAFLLPGQKPPRVIAHRAVTERFARYERTRRHNAALNARQFGGAVQEAETSEKFDNFKRPPIMPDTFYDDALTIEVGGVRFDIRHGRGETDDHSYVHCPGRGVLCSGDFFIWSVPNAGNPQKVQRYPWDWADALRNMAALDPRSLCPGHGGPVVGDAAKIARMLTETADYLDAIVDQTIAAMEAGSPPHVDIVRAVVPPPSASPWLQPVYDEAEFIVRNVIRYYGGWWGGRPSDLKPAPRAAVAAEVARLAGGAAALLARAREIAAAGDLRLACHLADYALEAHPRDLTVQRSIAALYEERAAGETSLMARNLFRSAAAYAREGRPFC